jgi:glycosyltransferase involved in cell wall biosynthesis
MPDSHVHSVTASLIDTGQKIAIVCHGHPSISKGGAEAAAYALFLGLRELGVDAIFIGACEYRDRHRLALASEREFAVYHDGDRYDHFYHLAAPAVETQLRDILVDRRITIVSFHHFYVYGLNSLRAVRGMPGVRCYYTIHEFLAICHNHGQMVTREAQLLCPQASNEACVSCFPERQRTQFTLRKETMLEVLGSFEGFISPSHFLAERFVKWGLPSDRMTVIENGLLDTSHPPARRSTEGTWTFGYFGQINPYKGVDVLLDAADLIAADPDLAATLRLRIHGNLVGQSQTFLDRFNAAARDYRFLSYAGAYSSAAVYELMSQCDYIIVPSKWWENSPVVIQEAFAVRVPVLCTGIGGLAEKVRAGVSGLHFARGDAADLLRTMKLAAEPGQSESLRAGIPPVFSAMEMARSYLKFFAADRQAIMLPRPRVADGAR